MSKSKVTVRVLEDHIVHTHPAHVDGLRAPDAEALAAKGVVTACAEAHGGGERLELPEQVAQELEASGAVERV